MSLDRYSMGLQDLPVELLYEIQLFALSEHLPYASRHLKRVFESSPTSYRAQYISDRILTDPATWPPNFYTRVLRFRLCTPPVLSIICRRCASATGLQSYTDIPKHLFRLLEKKATPQWTEHHHPLPFLRSVESHLKLNVNAHDGFALSMAVHVGFLPLIRWLLDAGADPKLKDALALTVAIRKKDLGLLRMLIEPGYGYGMAKKKRRRIPDRVDCKEFPALLKVAVRRDARDIVVYLQTKGSVPDIETVLGLL